ncbi:MAG: sugar phosphate nucleotidyltransferase [Microthrixaceae bacterium]|nr:sugar phosphate nucleotidyltransferase [Microthrixaceae bacterium]
MDKVTKVVIPAAGLGTRFLPATKAQPKEMLPVVDRPAIQYVVEEAVRAGLDDILIITGRSKRTLEDHFLTATSSSNTTCVPRARTTSWPGSWSWPTWPTSTTSARVSLWGSAMPCRLHASTSETNRSW